METGQVGKSESWMANGDKVSLMNVIMGRDIVVKRRLAGWPPRVGAKLLGLAFEEREASRC